MKDSKVQKSFSCVSYATITDFSLKHVKMSCKILLTTPYIYYKNNKNYISYINKLREFCNSFKGKLAVSYQFGDTHYQTTFGEGWTITKVSLLLRGIQSADILPGAERVEGALGPCPGAWSWKRPYQIRNQNVLLM